MVQFRFIFLSSFLYVLLLVGVFASEDVSWETYWQSALPKTLMPQAVQELLHPENWQFGPGGQSTYTGISKDALNINTIQSGSAFPTAGPESYANAATGKIPVEQGVTTFFLEKDLHLGKKMTLHFPKSTNNANLLPRRVAKSMPFSSNKLPEILNRFSLKPESAEAEIVRQTIEECEEPSIEGEDKYCATSLESLVDFSVSKLGKYAEVFSTKVDEENKQEYRIARRVEKVGERSVVCHKQKYAYAVFYCHEIRSTRAYKVSLVGADGTKAEAVAVCHSDTRKWNIKLLAFQLLKIKPGTVPVCHFLPSGNLLWVSN